MRLLVEGTAAVQVQYAVDGPDAVQEDDVTDDHSYEERRRKGFVPVDEGHQRRDGHHASWHNQVVVPE